MKGRKKTPTANLKLIGSRHARGREGEPSPDLGVPDMPPFVSEDAKQYWPEVAKELEVARVLTLTDAMALGMLCETLAQFYAAQADVLVNGYYRTKEFVVGVEVKRVNPMVKVMNEAHDRFYRWAREFGMTPSARAGITICKSGEKKGKAAGHFGKLG